MRHDLSHLSQKELDRVSRYFREKVLPTLKFFISYNHTMLELPAIPKSLMEATDMGRNIPNALAPKPIKSSEIQFGTLDSQGSFVSIGLN